MSRQNIFTLLKESFDLAKELERINQLFTSNIFCTPYTYNANMKKPKYLADVLCFHDWINRNGCIDCDDMEEALGISDILEDDDPSIEDALVFIEYVENIIFICNQYIVDCEDKIEKYAEYYTLFENIDELLSKLNYKAVEFRDKEMVLLVEKDAGVTAAAEISDKDTALHIYQYNHYALKGNVAEKRKILLYLADKVEPMFKLLNNQSKQLVSDAGFLLNNLNIRHNNKDKNGKNYKEYVAKLTKAKLEHWYDETYQVLLLCMLEHDNLSRIKKIQELKKKVNGEE